MYTAKHARRHRTFKQVLRDVVLTYGVAVGSILGTATFANTTSADLTPSSTETSSCQAYVVVDRHFEPIRWSDRRDVFVRDFKVREVVTVKCSDGTTETVKGPWRHKVKVIVREPCFSDEGESDGPCVWDARHFGNGKGDSFRIDRFGKVHEIGHQRAHRLLGLAR